MIAQLSQKYSDPQYYGVVTALALLNGKLKLYCATLIKRVEPATYLNDQLLQTARQYWYDAYGAARYPFGNSDKSGLALVIHDGFQPLSTFDNYMVEPEFEDVLLDTHNYQVFNDEYVAWNWDQHISVSSFLRLMNSAYTTSERL